MVVVAARPEKVDPRVVSKTSLILATKHEEGALLGCLNALAQRHLNLTKLESRPRPHTPWEYLFYVDFEGNLDDPTVVEALRELSTQTSYLRVLGSYPARTTREPRAREARPAPAHPAAPPKIEPASLAHLPNQLTSRRHREADTVFEVAGVHIGGGEPVIVVRAGNYRSRNELLELVRGVRAAGANLLWAPCFDAESRERAQALGEDPLALLEEAGASQGLPVVTEVLHPADVDRAVQRADVLVVGASHMQNRALLHEVGRVDRPVILERGTMASIDEWLSAAEYLFERGNRRIILCERGIRTFEQSLPSTLDLASVALLRERTHLPVFVDPSQATGRASLASRLAESARHAGAQGIVLSVAVEGASDGVALGLRELATTISRLSGS
jgi:chorismate mutase/prephenate dehydratase